MLNYFKKQIAKCFNCHLFVVVLGYRENGNFMSDYLFNFDPANHITSKEDQELLKTVPEQYYEGVVYKEMNGNIYIISVKED